MALFSTNPYSSYHASNSKEFIELNKAALIHFKPDKQFDLLPSSADAFAAALEASSKRFSYHGALKRIPTTCTVAAADKGGAITFGNQKDLLESWNQISLETILKNANQTWGDKTWTNVIPHAIEDLSAARGELTAGVRGTLNDEGKKIFLLRWRSTMMAHHCIQLLTPEAQGLMKIYQSQFEWFHDGSGETIQDGLTLATLILQKMRPNVKINVFNEIMKIKQLKLDQFGNNVTTWLTKMEEKRINIELKVPGSYHDDQYIMDIFQGALEAKCKAFCAEVQSMKQKWLLGNADNWTKDNIVSTLIQYFTNMSEDGTWKKENAETDQIIALTTIVKELSSKLERNTIALATATSGGGAGGGTGGSGGGAGGGGGTTRREKKAPYTVKPWRLEHKGDTVTVDGDTWHWCTKDHYSGGNTYNGMYAKHDNSGHDAWRKEIDDKREANHRARKGAGGGANTPGAPVAPTPANMNPTKKLALSESLRTALCTQAGLSADVADRIWTEACRDSGND